MKVKISRDGESKYIFVHKFQYHTGKTRETELQDPAREKFFFAYVLTGQEKYDKRGFGQGMPPSG